MRPLCSLRDETVKLCVTALLTPQPGCSKHPVAAVQNSTGAQSQQFSGKGKLPKSKQKGRRRKHHQETQENKYLQSLTRVAEEEEEVGGSWEAKAAVFNYSLGRDLGCGKSPAVSAFVYCMRMTPTSKRRDTDALHACKYSSMCRQIIEIVDIALRKTGNKIVMKADTQVNEEAHINPMLHVWGT